MPEITLTASARKHEHRSAGRHVRLCFAVHWIQRHDCASVMLCTSIHTPRRNSCCQSASRGRSHYSARRLTDTHLELVARRDHEIVSSFRTRATPERPAYRARICGRRNGAQTSRAAGQADRAPPPCRARVHGTARPRRTVRIGLLVEPWSESGAS